MQTLMFVGAMLESWSIRMMESWNMPTVPDLFEAILQLAVLWATRTVSLVTVIQ